MQLDEDDTKPSPISFWLSGIHCNAADGEVVCPAWMVPPTEIANPTMIFCQDEKENYSRINFDGRTILYAKSFLKFNPEPDTPVVLKRIGDKVYALLVREHLSLVFNHTNHCLCMLRKRRKQTHYLA